MKDLLVTQSRFLTMSSAEMMRHHRDVVRQLQSLSPQETWLAEYMRYVRFIQRVLGVDIEIYPEQDPFYEVTGFPIREFAVEKWKVMPNARGYSSVGYPDFVSADHILDLEKRNEICSGQESFFDTESMRSIPAGVRFRFFGMTDMGNGLVMDQCVLEYMNITPKNGQCIRSVLKGVTFIEPSVIEELRTKGILDQVYNMLHFVNSIASHDFTGHATIDINFAAGGPEDYCYEGVSKEEMEDWEIFYGTQHNQLNWQMNFKEQRRLSLHHELMKVIMRRSPVFERLLRQKFRQFHLLLWRAFIVERISRATFEYCVKIFLYYLMRIIGSLELAQWSIEIGCGREFDDLLDKNKKEMKLASILYKQGSGAPITNYGTQIPQNITLDEIEFVPHDVFFQTLHRRIYAKVYA